MPGAPWAWWGMDGRGQEERREERREDRIGRERRGERIIVDEAWSLQCIVMGLA